MRVSFSKLLSFNKFGVAVVILVVSLTFVTSLTFLLVACGDSSTSLVQSQPATSGSVVTGRDTTTKAKAVKTTVAAAASSNDSTEPTIDISQAGRVGVPVSMNGYKLTINSIDMSAGFNDSDKPQEGNIFLSVDVTIESSKPSGVSANLIFSQIRAADGNVFNPSFFTKEPKLAETDNIPAGQKQRGWITFELPKDKAQSAGLIFVYQPAVVDSTYIQVKLS